MHLIIYSYLARFGPFIYNLFFILTAVGKAQIYLIASPVTSKIFSICYIQSSFSLSGFPPFSRRKSAFLFAFLVPSISHFRFTNFINCLSDYSKILFHNKTDNYTFLYRYKGYNMLHNLSTHLRKSVERLFFCYICNI